MEAGFLHLSPFYELTALLALSVLVGIVGQLLRQPMIVSFIAVCILAGPSALDIVQSRENIEILAELGVAVLLFLVGLKLDLKLVRSLGSVALATGLGQVLFTSVVGFLLGLALGLGVVTSIYVAVALTFSSTIIIVKLLSDKREVDSLHGRIAIGFLIVQDLVVVLAMMVLSAWGVGSQANASGRRPWLGSMPPARTVLARTVLYKPHSPTETSLGYRLTACPDPANGAFAMSEIALVTSRKSRLQRPAEDGDKSSRIAMRLGEEPTQFLSTVQIGILNGIVGEAALAGPLGDIFHNAGLSARTSSIAATTVVVVAITYLTIVVGELVPKRLAQLNAEGVARLIARPIPALCIPVVIFRRQYFAIDWQKRADQRQSH